MKGGVIMDNKKKRGQNVWATLYCGLLLCVAASSVEAQMSSPNFQMAASMMNSGGGSGSSTNFDVRNSMGQGMPTGISKSTHFGMFAGFQACTVEDFILPTAQRGDVNGDMSINILDVLTTINHILGIAPLTGDALIRADCNADGEINVLDALGIVNVILGIGECVP